MESVSRHPQDPELTSPMSWRHLNSLARALLHTVGLFHSMDTGTPWLKKSEESVAGKSGSSNRTPFWRHSCLSCSKDFPSDCVIWAWPEPELLLDRVDWRGIFFCFFVCEWRWRDVRWLVKNLLCLRHRDKPVWAVDTPSSRHKLVCPPSAGKLTHAGTLSLFHWAWSTLLWKSTPDELSSK